MKFLLQAGSLAWLACVSPMVAAAEESYPSKAIRIVVPTVPGGGLDLATRLIADKLSRALDQTVLVENLPGADTVLGVRAVKAAEADGYTLLSHAGQFLSTPLIKADSNYHPLTDFRGIGRTIRYPMVIELAPDKAEQNITELFAAAKANPGQLSYGSGGVGSPPHMALGALLAKTGTQMTHVPYKGIGQALPDVAAGRTYVVADGYGSSRSYIEAKKLRPIAVTSNTRIPELPDVPTVKEQGIDYTYEIWQGLLVPANTPDAVVARLSEALQEVLKDPELEARFKAEASTTIQESPAEFDAFMKADYENLIEVIRDLNLAP